MLRGAGRAPRASRGFATNRRHSCQRLDAAKRERKPMLLERGERGVQLHAAVLEQGDLVYRAGLTRRIAAGEDDGSPLTGEPEQPNPLIGVKRTQRFIEKDELGVTEQRGG